MQNLKANKTFGQNFLQSTKALDTIIKTADIKEKEIVLEIGPGKGALTEKLINSKAIVLAIEKDRRMFDFLTEKFSKNLNKELFLINKDILEFDLENFLEKKLGQKKIKYKLIANIPYYITGLIIRKFLESQSQPEKMVLLVQKEVANRIVASDQKESILSISVKAYCLPKYVETVKAGSFVPAPKVDSAIVLFENISKEKFLKSRSKSQIREKLFFEILNAGFAHKRKKLLNNLKDWQKENNQKNKIVGEINFAEIFQKLKIDPQIRAEKISPEMWFEILGECPR